MSMNIFERALRQKLRFACLIGNITTEQLWDLPLTSGGHSQRSNLDDIAIAVNAELTTLEKGSFVNEKPDPRKVILTLQLDILKHVIAAKLADKAAAEKAAETKARKQKLLDALANKQDEALATMSEDQIKAELDKLSA